MERRRYFFYSLIASLSLISILILADQLVFELKKRWVISAGFQADFIESQLRQSEQVKRLRHLILGDSTMAMNFATPRLSQFAVSSTLFGSSSPEAYYLLKRWLDAGARPKCVLLGLSYGGVRAHLRRDQWWILPHTRLFDKASLEEIRQASERLASPPAQGLTRFEFELRVGLLGFWYGGIPLDVIQRSVFNPITRARTSRIRESLTSSQGWHILSGMTDQHSAYQEDRNQWVEHLIDASGFEALPLTDFYLEKIYDLAEAHKLRLIQVYGPLSEDFNTEKTHQWHKAFTEHLHALHKRRPREHSELQIGLKFLPTAKAFDPSHMLIDGAREWTDEVIRNIRCSSPGDFSAPP
ncbi:MAG TPA: hypothetical protein PLZ57_05865 [Pseudobdellovibrionaceae bacterium]|nr:hypothetical protein [Pseudobdellovibrionaceae bacterium]